MADRRCLSPRPRENCVRCSTRGRPLSAGDAGVAEGVAAGLWPHAETVRLLADVDLADQVAVGRGEHVDGAVVAARQPQLGAVGGHVAHVGAAAAGDVPGGLQGAGVGVEHAEAAVEPVGDVRPRPGVGPSILHIRRVDGTVRGMAARPIPVNATAAAILGLLRSGSLTGGELVGAAGEQFGGFFSVTRSQVYRELPALVEAGLLRLGKLGARASQQYRITAAGKRSFKAWLAGPGGVDAMRSPLVLRLLHAGALSRASAPASSAPAAPPTPSGSRRPRRRRVRPRIRTRARSARSPWPTSSRCSSCSTPSRPGRRTPLSLQRCARPAEVVTPMTSSTPTCTMHVWGARTQVRVVDQR